jgi:hypothetical protein
MLAIGGTVYLVAGLRLLAVILRERPEPAEPPTRTNVLRKTPR